MCVCDDLFPSAVTRRRRFLRCVCSAAVCHPAVEASEATKVSGASERLSSSQIARSGTAPQADVPPMGAALKAAHCSRRDAAEATLWPQTCPDLKDERGGSSGDVCHVLVSPPALFVALLFCLFVTQQSGTAAVEICDCGRVERRSNLTTNVKR